jgi:hypothetical protein
LPKQNNESYFQSKEKINITAFLSMYTGKLMVTANGSNLWILSAISRGQDRMACILNLNLGVLIAFGRVMHS